MQTQLNLLVCEREREKEREREREREREIVQNNVSQTLVPK
jgi:hypothetical protein